MVDFNDHGSVPSIIQLSRSAGGADAGREELANVPCGREPHAWFVGPLDRPCTRREVQVALARRTPEQLRTFVRTLRDFSAAFREIFPPEVHVGRIFVAPKASNRHSRIRRDCHPEIGATSL